MAICYGIDYEDGDEDEEGEQGYAERFRGSHCRLSITRCEE